MAGPGRWRSVDSASDWTMHQEPSLKLVAYPIVQQSTDVDRSKAAIVHPDPSICVSVLVELYHLSVQTMPQGAQLYWMGPSRLPVAN